MSNTCIGPSIGKNDFFHFVSSVLWTRRPDGDTLPEATAAASNGAFADRPPPLAVQSMSKAPEPVKITTKPEEAAKAKPASTAAPKPAADAVANEQEAKASTDSSSSSSGSGSGGEAGAAPRSPHRPKVPTVKRVSSAGLLVGSVLKRKTERSIATYLCIERVASRWDEPNAQK